MILNGKIELENIMEAFQLKTTDIKWAWITFKPNSINYHLKENPNPLEVSDFFINNDFMYDNVGPYFVNGVVMFYDGSFLKRINRLYGRQNWDYFKIEMPYGCKRI